jgi:hypothetical protein
VKAIVELQTTVELDTDDAVVDEIMSQEWQRSFYTFHDRTDAVRWLAGVLHDWGSTESVDGLAGIGRATVREIGRDSEVVEVSA